MIASVAFRNFRALRNARLALTPFNLVIGPNGSGKTSLIEAVMRLGKLARLAGDAAEAGEAATGEAATTGPEIVFGFTPPHEGTEVVLGCVSDLQCDLLRWRAVEGGPGAADWAALRGELVRARAYLFDHRAIGEPAADPDGAVAPELAGNAGNLATVLAWRERHRPEAHAAMGAELLRVLGEFDDWRVTRSGAGRVSFALRLKDGGQWVAAENLSQGTLYFAALLALAFDPAPPAVVGIEEVDRGIHPRWLREVRDALYRLSHPTAHGMERAPVQVIATSHSPYLLDLFRHHPDEVVIAEKQGQAASFARLSDRADLGEMLEGGALGDLWYSGVLGGVPPEA